MEDKHDEIMKGIGGLYAGQVELVRRVGIQNGRVFKSEESINDLKVKYQLVQDQNLEMTKTVAGLLKNMNDFIDRQEKKADWWLDKKSQLVVATIMLLIGAFLGTYLPYFWEFVGKLLKSG